MDHNFARMPMSQNLPETLGALLPEALGAFHIALILMFLVVV